MNIELFVVKKYLSMLVILLFLSSSFTVFSVSAGPALPPVESALPDIVEMMQQINESLLFSYLGPLTAIGPRYTGTENCTKGGQYLYDAFHAMGVQVKFHNWTEDKFTSRNIEATLPGTDTSSNATFLMTAHYDTVAVSPGGDDDGSGVGALLAAASVMRHYSFKYTIRFVAFSGEEVGSYGSFAYARDAYRHGDNIVAVLNADMIGYANTTQGGSIIDFHYLDRSKWIADYAVNVSTTYLPFTNMSVVELPNYIGSDHQAFIDYGYDAVWIVHPDGYPWGHSQNDTVDRLNGTYYAKATRFLVAVLGEFASSPIKLQVILTSPMEGYFYLFDTPLFPLNLGRAWYLNLRGSTVIVGTTMSRAIVLSNQSIRYVIFCIDGNFQFGWPTTPPYENPIEGIHYPLLGKHTLKVYAYSTSGDVATDEMGLYIFMLSSQFKKQRSG